MEHFENLLWEPIVYDTLQRVAGQIPESIDIASVITKILRPRCRKLMQGYFLEVSCVNLVNLAKDGIHGSRQPPAEPSGDWNVGGEETKQENAPPHPLEPLSIWVPANWVTLTLPLTS
jgi:hypothetical protein